MKKKNLNFKEFLAFLLIYASHADINFSEEEKVLIKQTVSEEVFEVVNHEFNQLTDYQALEVILSYKEPYFSSQKEKDHLFEELQKLFLADGEFSVLEKELLMFLDKLM